MKIIDVEQGSSDWIKARLGIPTASRFDRILTPTGQLSKASVNYMYELIAESIIGQPCDPAQSQFMERGNELEQEAVDLYEFQKDISVNRIGFCLLEDGSAGCSPDGLVGMDGGLEIKCPAAKTHIGYILDERSFYRNYRLQVQGSLYVTERDWWDLLSYNPVLPNPIVRIHRDDDFIEKLAAALREFNDKLAEMRAKVEKMEVVEVPIEGFPFN
jgi:hypothetical protein